MTATDMPIIVGEENDFRPGGAPGALCGGEGVPAAAALQEIA